MGGSRDFPPPPRPGVLPAPLAGCSLWLCPELSAWSNPTVLPRALAAWVLQSLNPLLRVEPGQGSGEVLPSSRLQQLLPFVVILGIVCPHHCLGFLPGGGCYHTQLGTGGVGGQRGEVKGVTILLPARESRAGLLHWACEAETRGEQVLHAGAEASHDHLHSWQMCWVLPAPPFPGRCQVVLGLQPALTRKEGIVQEDGPLSGLYCSVGLSNCKCVTLAHVGPCATAVCQIRAVSIPGPRLSLQWAKVISWQDARVLCRG